MFPSVEQINMLVVLHGLGNPSVRLIYRCLIVAGQPRNKTMVQCVEKMSDMDVSFN